jgi:signal peptidase I
LNRYQNIKIVNLRMKNVFREILITAGMALVIFLLLQTTIQSSVVDGSSMKPGLEDGQRLIVIKIAYLCDPPERGDIVIIHPPVDPDKQWVKRVIGIPGDTIEIEDGTVYLNGIPLDEPYIAEAPHYTMDKIRIEEDHYFVMGDNRNNSTDSHTGWTVERDQIVGEVWLRFWPLSDWGVVSGYPIDNTLELNDKTGD